MRVVVIKKDCKKYCVDTESSIKSILEFGGEILEYREATEDDVIIYKK